MWNTIQKAVSIAAALLLFMLMCLTFFDVVGRNAFNHPVPGAIELSEILLACMIFFLLPGIAARREHIAVDIIDSVSGRKLNIVSAVLTGVFGAAFFAIAAYRLWTLAGQAIRFNSQTPILELPLYPMIYLMAVLSALNAIVFLAVMVKDVQRADAPRGNQIELI